MITREEHLTLRQHFPIVKGDNFWLHQRIESLGQLRGILPQSEFTAYAKEFYEKAKRAWEEAQKLGIT